MAGHPEAYVGGEETKSEESLSTKIVVQIEGRSIISFLKVEVFIKTIVLFSLNMSSRRCNGLTEDGAINLVYLSRCAQILA